MEEELGALKLALKDFFKTEKGSVLGMWDYGNSFLHLIGKNISLDDNSIDFARSELLDFLGKYFPNIMVKDTSIEFDFNSGKIFKLSIFLDLGANSNVEVSLDV